LSDDDELAETGSQLDDSNISLKKPKVYIYTIDLLQSDLIYYVVLRLDGLWGMVRVDRGWEICGLIGAGRCRGLIGACDTDV